MGNVVEVTTETFKSEIIDAAEPVVVDLWAPWCAPCRAAAPIMEQLATEYIGRIKVAKVNVDEHPEIASAFHVEGIPTFAVLYQGTLYGSVSGFGGRPHLASVFEEALKLPALAAAEPASTEATAAKEA